MVHISDFKGDDMGYDHIVIGTPIYMGSINKKIKNFILNNTETLNQKKLSIVVCAMNQEVIDETIKSNFSDKIRSHANIVYAGGSYNLAKLNFLERFMVKKIDHITESIDAIQFKALNAIIDQTT
jgi:menaquinone-dependent protoporphyrinogen oxidase